MHTVRTPFPHAAATFLAVLASVTLLASAARAQSPELRQVLAELRPVIEREMVDGRIPSLTVALVADGEVVWTEGFGQSNLWARTPAVPSTVYLVGSTFKAMSTVALMQLVEEGRIGLDDPVRDHLPAEIRIRDERPDQPVLVRHLLAHTSGLPPAFGGHAVWGETVPLPMDRYLADSLRVVGPPMDSVRYSNIAFTLVGYLVERVSGVEYKEYIRTRLFQPLGMRDTDFAPTPGMEERLAVPYVTDPEGRHRPAVRVKANVWPAGIVYGTIEDMGRWLAFNLGDGTAGGERVLRAETLDAMQTLQYPQFAGQGMAGGWGYDRSGYGLTWWTTTRGDERFFAHSGSVAGYTAFVMGNRTRGTGVTILSNGHRAHPHLVRISNLAVDLLSHMVAERVAM